ncbi:MAG: hypothetical protein NVV74_14140 [Magnetospirillum sp.]|nr:hypothetical protein [Magnetospirillum sp.]
MAVALLISLSAWPAQAVEHNLVRWKKTGQCEILTRLPLWGDHWITLGTYPSKAQAELALAKYRRTRACPADKSAKRADTPPDDRKAPVTYRGGRTENGQRR